LNKKPALKVDRYSSFLSSLDPTTIALIHEAFRIDRLKYLESEKDSLNVRVSSKLLSIGDGFFDVRSTLILVITKAGDEKPLVRFLATYDIHFHGKEINKRNVDRFITSELRLIIWPYYRELVNNASGRMHIPPIILPISGNKENK
jgi:preprotein translocase subunit SecB